VDWLYLALAPVMLAALLVLWIAGMRVYINNAGSFPRLGPPRILRSKQDPHPPEPPEGRERG
jgi:hypothetical protein